MTLRAPQEDRPGLPANHAGKSRVTSLRKGRPEFVSLRLGFHKHHARVFPDNPPDPARIALFGTAPHGLKHGIHLKPPFRCRLPLAPADFLHTLRRALK